MHKGGNSKIHKAKPQKKKIRMVQFTSLVKSVLYLNRKTEKRKGGGKAVVVL